MFRITGEFVEAAGGGWWVGWVDCNIAALRGVLEIREARNVREWCEGK
jgi:hypothetical protein